MARYAPCAVGALALTGAHLLLQTWLAGEGDPWGTRALATYGVASIIVFGVLVALSGMLARRDARIDADTGVWSRLQVTERLHEEVSRALRAGTPLAVVVVELAGISGAGRHLQAVASALRATCRSSDLLGRFAPDSFVVVTPATDAGGALVLADRIRRSVLLRYILESHALPPAAIALGVTHLEAGGNGSDDALVRAATEALERARQMGGGCAVLATPREP